MNDMKSIVKKYVGHRGQLKKAATGYSSKKGNYHSERYPEIVIFMKHGPEYITLIRKTVNMHNPEMFIELGTLHGGLTMGIMEGCSDVEIHSFDYKRSLSPGLSLIFFDNGVTCHRANLMLEKPSEDLVNLLTENKHRRKILYCDNGDKIKEVNTYAKYISPGDLIGCHDWLFEIGPNEIEETLRDFEPYDHEPYERMLAWTRFWIKK